MFPQALRLARLIRVSKNNAVFSKIAASKQVFSSQSCLLTRVSPSRLGGSKNYEMRHFSSTTVTNEGEEQVEDVLAMMQAMQEKMEKGEAALDKMIDALCEHDDKAFVSRYYEAKDIGFPHEDIVGMAEYRLDVRASEHLLNLLHKHLDELK
jgi:transcriptional regulator of heat shock response